MAGYYNKDKDYSKELMRTDLSAGERAQLTQERQNKIDAVYGGKEPTLADGSGKTGVERLAQILLIGDEALENAHAGGQIAQGLDLDAGGGVDRGEEICGIGEGKLLLRAVFGNGIVDGAFGQARNGIRTAVDEIS